MPFMRTRPCSYSGDGETWRLRIEGEENTVIAIDKMSSAKRGVQALELHLDDEELVWLHAMIGERMRERGIERAATARVFEEHTERAAQVDEEHQR